MPADKLRTGIHITDVRLFKKCRLWWNFASPLRMNLEVDRPNKNLIAGSGGHVAWAAYYNPENPRKLSTLMDAYSDWVCGAMDDLQTSSEEVRGSVVREIDLVWRCLINYAAWAERNDKFDVIATELRLEVPLPIIPGMYTYFEGTADAYIYMQGKYYLMEHKTASMIPDDESLMKDEQGIAYLWAAQVDEQTREAPPVGTIYNFLRKKVPTRPRLLKSGGLSRNKNIDTTFDVYLATVKEHGLDPKAYQSILYHLWQRDQTEDRFFHRTPPMVRSMRALNAFAARLIGVIVEMTSPSVSIYPSPDWFNCRWCPFGTPCTMFLEGLNPAAALRASYRKRQPRWPDIDPVEAT